jgi:DNA-directed RNA polymerase specialized sigma24 family protein
MTGPERQTEFADFVAVASPGLLRSAWLLTGDAGRAEDLLQTALAKTWRHWTRVVQAGNPEAYVRRVVFTTYVSWWRRRWRAEVPGLSVIDTATLLGCSAATVKVQAARALTALRNDPDLDSHTQEGVPI